MWLSPLTSDGAGEASYRKPKLTVSLGDERQMSPRKNDGLQTRKPRCVLPTALRYWLAVPANRIGYGVYSGAELKTIQEVISLSVFVLFAVFYLGEKFTWNHGIGFAMIALGAFFIFKGPLK